MAIGIQLPIRPDTGGLQTEGFATGAQDTKPQKMIVPPRRVIPVIFLPGIMGSNLRISDRQRQTLIGKKNNIAWRPDNTTEAGKVMLNATVADRQLLLDANTTVVDIYDPTGASDVSGDARHDNVKLAKTFNSPLLTNDPQTVPQDRRQTAEQKARVRGWGETYFDSYGELLQHLESRLNGMFAEGRLQAAWQDVVGVDPATWMSIAALPQEPLTEAQLRKVATSCWFPVYAFGYNWLQSNGDSAIIIARRINAVIDALTKAKFDCPGVIVVTHSMGGMVGRALIHPDYGAMRDKVLGIVHGAQPSIGAAAAYKRIRAGFEDPGMMHFSIATATSSAGAKVAGNHGDEVTAVLANSPGGLQLLPTQAYGNGWLQVTHNGQKLDAWPKHGDPYEEIYKVRGKWYSLIREEWINPSLLPPQRGGGSFEGTSRYLDHARTFHQAILDTYHDCSFAHYGADHERPSFGDVVWNIETQLDARGWDSWVIISDTKQGQLGLGPDVEAAKAAANTSVARESFLSGIDSPITTDSLDSLARVHATIVPPTEPGDETVPMRSSDHQLRSGKFKGIFRQVGYEHQGSYKNDRVIASTLYSIVRIAQQAKWKSGT